MIVESVCKEGSRMTVNEYRKNHPNCEYCKHRIPPFDVCQATNKRMRKRTAKKCPCYVPEEWGFEKNVVMADDGKFYLVGEWGNNTV